MMDRGSAGHGTGPAASGRVAKDAPDIGTLHEVREYGDPGAVGRDPLEIESRAEADKSIPEVHEVGIPDKLREEIEEIISRYPQVRSASIPALWASKRPPP